MTLYMVHLQFAYFLQNDDFVSMSYRHFNSEEKDEYPIFTICVYGFNGAIFDESNDIFNSTQADPYLYQNFLKGRVSHNDHSFDFGSINYDDVVLDIQKSYVIALGSGTSLTCLFDESKGNCETKKSFTLISSYSLESLVCLTKSISYRKDLIQYYDLVYLNSTLLYEKQLKVYIYIHQKGKLSRALQKSAKPIKPEQYKGGLTRHYEVNEVEILRRREKSKMPCNESLTDEDGYIVRKIVIEIGCIPAYWEKFKNQINFPSALSKCYSPQQYTELRSKVHRLTKKFSTMKSSYLQPCTEMKTSVATKKEIAREGYLRLYFLYLNDSYKEVVNLKAYTAETLLSQIGGFVGKNRLLLAYKRNQTYKRRILRGLNNIFLNIIKLNSNKLQECLSRFEAGTIALTHPGGSVVPTGYCA